MERLFFFLVLLHVHGRRVEVGSALPWEYFRIGQQACIRSPVCAHKLQRSKTNENIVRETFQQHPHKTDRTEVEDIPELLFILRTYRDTKLDPAFCFRSEFFATTVTIIAGKHCRYILDVGDKVLADLVKVLRTHGYLILIIGFRLIQRKVLVHVLGIWQLPESLLILPAGELFSGLR